MRLSVAVCEPMYEVNVGHIARLVMNFGLDELILVNPKVDLSKARIFAAHAAHIVDNAKLVEFDYLKRFDMLIGTTSVPARRRGNIVRDAIQPKELAGIINSIHGNACILLGRESIGLTNEELEGCSIVVSIDTPTEYKALNISHALAIILYEIYRDSTHRIRDIASKHEIELLKDYAIRLARLSMVREHKIPMLNLAIERVVSRGMATSKEVMLLVTLFRSAINAIESKSYNINANPAKDIQ
jgi:TrmH family RNA methyltransferase